MACLISLEQPGQEAGPALAPMILQAVARELKALKGTVFLRTVQFLPH